MLALTPGGDARNAVKLIQIDLGVSPSPTIVRSIYSAAVPAGGPPESVFEVSASRVLPADEGSAFGAALRGAPHSAFLAEGSAITVHRPVRIA